MIHKVRVDLQPRILELELDENLAPKTVRSIIDLLPITVPIHAWGEELYTDPIPVKVSSENSKDVVDLYDVAYWPPGNAICLFFGPTPMGTKDEIKPYSPVNVIGKIKETDKNLLKNIKDGTKVRFY
ncbi:MAG: cyclophilin-like fold protein [Nitrososphaera sp.]|jgi:hypothetical protein